MKSTKAFVEITGRIKENAKAIIGEMENLYPHLTDENDWCQWGHLRDYLNDFIEEYDHHFGECEE